MTTTNEMATIRITCSTNSLASAPERFRREVLSGVKLGRSINVRHNGGKVIVVTCLPALVDDVCAALDATYMVTSYEVA